MTASEVGESFNIDHALRWGTLPKIWQLPDDKEKADYLRAYALTYLREEIAAEQIVRRLDPFRQFLEVAAQCNGEPLNYAKIGRDVGVDQKTVQSFFLVLEETLIGTLLPAYHRSVRKQQRLSPKFYFFDLGVKRALERTLDQILYPRTFGYGKTFEHFIILEILRLASYHKPDWRFSYLRTKEGKEIDLIIDRPGQSTALIEIKSTEQVSEEDTALVERFLSDIPKSEAFCLSQDPWPKKLGSVHCLPWQKGLIELGLHA